MCATVCEENGFDGSRRAAVHFTDGVDELSLFQGNIGVLGSYTIWVGNAFSYPFCVQDQWEGFYEWFAASGLP